MTKRATAGPVVLLLCVAVTSAFQQKVPETTTPLPAVSVVAAEGVPASVADAHLVTEGGKTIIEMTIANTGTEPVLRAEVTVLVYRPNGKRRGTQAVSYTISGSPESPGRLPIRDTVTAVQINSRDRVFVGLTAFDTPAGLWTRPDFADRTDNTQLPVVSVADSRPLPVALEGARLLENDGQMQLQVDLVNRADEPLDHATLALAVYDEAGKRLGLQEMDVPGANLPLAGKATVSLRLPLDATISIQPGHSVRLGVSCATVGGIESKSGPASLPPDPVVLDFDEAARLAITEATVVRDEQGAPLRVELVVENRTRDAVRGFVAALVFRFSAGRGGYDLKSYQGAGIPVVPARPAERSASILIHSGQPEDRVVIGVVPGGDKNPVVSHKFLQQAIASLR
jgi:hypothetical protein